MRKYSNIEVSIPITVDSKMVTKILREEMRNIYSREGDGWENRFITAEHPWTRKDMVIREATEKEKELYNAFDLVIDYLDNFQ